MPQEEGVYLHLLVGHGGIIADFYYVCGFFKADGYLLKFLNSLLCELFIIE